MMDRLADRSWGWWGSWSLRGLLLTAAALPTLLTLLAILLLNVGSQERLRVELEGRATLVAGALAEASEYGLISGNAAALDRSVRELLAHDRSIAAIDILDASRRSFVSLPGQPLAAGLPSVELPVRSSVPDIDFFDRATPHVSLAEDLQPTFRLGPVAGYVRVTMTTEALQRAQQRRLGLELGVVAAAGLAGLLVVALMARRLRGSLQGLLSALQGMRQGRYTVTEGPALSGELRRLQGAVLELAEALGAAGPGPSDINGISGISADRAPPTLPEGHAGITRRLLGRLDAALVTVRLSANQAARQADAAGPPADQHAAAQTAARILALADQAQAAGEALIEPLRQRIVEALGLDTALAELLQACTRAQPACAFSLQQDAAFGCADTAQATEVYRAVQGALGLVVASAQASQVNVLLTVLPQPQGPTPSADDPSSARADEALTVLTTNNARAVRSTGNARAVRVVISDNGAGEASHGTAARLARWRDGLVARGARVDVQQAPTGGTTLVVTLPPTATIAAGLAASITAGSGAGAEPPVEPPV